MESGEFLSYLSHPTTLGDDSLKQLERVVKEYPYCQSAQLLYTFNLYLQQHSAYPVQLKKAAAFASDRKRLKALIDQYQPVAAVTVAPEPKRHPVAPEPKRHPVAPEPKRHPVAPEPKRHPEAAEPKRHPVAPEKQVHRVIPPPGRSVAFTPVFPSAGLPREEAVREKLLDIVHRRLAEIEKEHSGESIDPSMPEDPLPIKDTAKHIEPLLQPRITFTVGSAPTLSKEELIERFIREEPKISSPRTAFLKPNPSGDDPERKDDEIVSETLAILYHKQGNTAKAIRVYEKLRLLFPEKSGYFAARIQALLATDAADAQENGE